MRVGLFVVVLVIVMMALFSVVALRCLMWRFVGVVSVDRLVAVIAGRRRRRNCCCICNRGADGGGIVVGCGSCPLFGLLLSASLFFWSILVGQVTSWRLVVVDRHIVEFVLRRRCILLLRVAALPASV